MTREQLKAALNADVFLFTLLFEIIVVQRSASFLVSIFLKIFVEHMLTQICSKEVRLARKTLVAFVSPHLSSVTWKGSFSQCLHFENERMDIYVK